MQRAEHCMDIQAATIRGQNRQIQAGEVGRSKFVEKVRDFLRKVGQHSAVAEPALLDSCDVLPPERTPAYVVAAPSSKLMFDFAPALCPSPDIAADTQASSFIISLLIQGTSGIPPPICAQRVGHSISLFSDCVFPAVILETFVTIVNAR
jgi:hypothetical protein